MSFLQGTEGHNRPKWDKNHTAFPMDDFDDFGV